MSDSKYVGDCCCQRGLGGREEEEVEMHQPQIIIPALSAVPYIIDLWQIYLKSMLTHCIIGVLAAVWIFV